MDEEREIKNNILLEFLIEKGPLGAVFITVAFNFLLICKEIFGKPINLSTLVFYAGSVIIGTVVFSIVLLMFYFYENIKNKKCFFRIIKEEDEYDIQEKNNGELRVVCKQYFKIKAIKENRDVFRLFHPLQGFIPIKFEFPDGIPDLLDSEELKNNTDGVQVFFKNRQFMKDKPTELKVKWTYDMIPLENGLKAAIIRRPTSHLAIFVVLPSSQPKPNRYGWDMYNAERYLVKGGETNCRKYGERFCLSKNFRRTKEGFSYTIWWDSKSESSKQNFSYEG